MNVICLGELLVDFVGVERADLVDAATFRRFPGGSAGNVAVGVARLGHSASIVTRLGTDPFGDFLVQTMRGYGVDTTSIVRDPNHRTGLAFISLDEKRVPRYVFFRHPSASMFLTPRDIGAGSIERAEVLYTSSMSLVTSSFRKTCYAATRRARRAGALVAFDVNLRRSLWRSDAEAVRVIGAFLRNVDILKLDEQELEFLVGARGREATMLFDRLPRLRLLALTRGKEGSILSTSKESSVEIPALPLSDEEVVDTTGAGDAFMSALIAQILSSGLFRGRESPSDAERLKTIGAYATAAAAYTIQRPGVIPALPSHADVAEIVARSGGPRRRPD